MSATNRGGERSPADFYATPPWCVARLFETDPFLFGEDFLEPSAGDGAIVRATNELYMGCNDKPPKWTLCELREECRLPLSGLGNVRIGDFLRTAKSFAKKQHHGIIGNPPFRLAEEFVRTCVELARGWKRPAPTIMLLRLDFLGSEGRAEMYAELGAPNVYVLPNRPSFTGNGSDSCDYAWLVWPEERQNEGRLRILDTTPRADRRGPKLPPELERQAELFA